MRRPLACIFLMTTVFGLLGIWLIASIDPRPRIVTDDQRIEDLRKVIAEKDAIIQRQKEIIAQREQK